MSNHKDELEVKTGQIETKTPEAPKDEAELSEVESEQVAGGLLSNNAGCANAYKC